MKQYLLTLLAFLVVLTATCQETKEVIIKSDGQISEKYYVLKSDEKIKHGKYIFYYKVSEKEYKERAKKKQTDWFIAKEGYYNLGKKDSAWIEYLAPRRGNGEIIYKAMKTHGKYKDDKKVGVWSTNKVEIIEKYDYDSNKKIAPIIKISADYPESAKEEGISGTVTVSFHTANDCSVDNINVIKGLRADFDKAAIDAVQKWSALYKKYGQVCEEKNETIDINFKFL